jgi:hypothetical protein
VVRGPLARNLKRSQRTRRRVFTVSPASGVAEAQRCQANHASRNGVRIAGRSRRVARCRCVRLYTLPATIVPTSFGLRHHYRNLNLGRRVALRTLASFLATFAVLRVITAIIRFQIFPHGPFRYVITRSGLHIHHLFWGILLLMATGFAALATRAPVWHLRIAIVFGIALGLTLDEFAMWLRLADVYWTPQGIESIKAAAVAAALLAAYGFGQPFWHAAVRDLFARR